MKTVLPVKPGSMLTEERDRLLAEGLVVTELSDADPRSGVAPRGAPDLGASLVDLLGALAERLGPTYGIRLSGTIDLTPPPATVLGGGGPPLNANGGALMPMPDTLHYVYANNTGATMWLFVAGSSFTLTPSAVTQIFAIEPLLAQACCLGVLLYPTPGVPAGTMGRACRVPHGSFVTIAWPAGSAPRVWVRGLMAGEVLPPAQRLPGGTTSA